MTYKKFYYRQSKQKGFAELDKEETVDCTAFHEDEYYIWDEKDSRYHEAIVEWHV